MAAATRTHVTVFQPGYRWDALVVFPEAGDYCIIDGGSSPAPASTQTLPADADLGTVQVAGGTPVTGDLSEYLQDAARGRGTANCPTMSPQGEDGSRRRAEAHQLRAA